MSYIQPGGLQCKQKEYYSVGINFSFTSTLYLHLPTLLLCLCLPPFTAHLLSFTSPLSVSRFPALWHELSVLPVIPIIEPCSGAENRGLKSQMCGAQLFCTRSRGTQACLWSPGPLRVTAVSSCLLTFRGWRVGVSLCGLRHIKCKLWFPCSSPFFLHDSLCTECFVRVTDTVTWSWVLGLHQCKCCNNRVTK